MGVILIIEYDGKFCVFNIHRLRGSMVLAHHLYIQQIFLSIHYASVTVLGNS